MQYSFRTLITLIAAFLHRDTNSQIRDLWITIIGNSRNPSQFRTAFYDILGRAVRHIDLRTVLCLGLVLGAAWLRSGPYNGRRIVARARNRLLYLLETDSRSSLDGLFREGSRLAAPLSELTPRWEAIAVMQIVGEAAIIRAARQAIRHGLLDRWAGIRRRAETLRDWDTTLYCGSQMWPAFGSYAQFLAQVNERFGLG